AGAGFETPEGTHFLMVEGESDIKADKFFHEKISPVLTLLPCRDFEEGRSFVARITDACGTGHSSGIFTFDEARIRRMGETMKSSRIMVRQPMVAGNGGAFFNGMPSTVTLGCGTWGGNITTENIHWRHFVNVTWLAMPLEPQRPSDEEIFAGVWAKFGR
ncbi:MAG: aldehyde dehydrogenase family protein, partial [Spirochaetales bacterium]